MHRFNILNGDEISTPNLAAVIEMIVSAKGSVLIGNGISVSRKQQL